MKQTLIVFRDKKNGAFLAKYKNNEGSLAFTAKYTKDIEDAVTIPPKKFEEEQEIYTGLLQAFGAEPLKMHMDITLTTMDGKEPEEIVDVEREKKENALKALAELFGGDD